MAPITKPTEAIRVGRKPREVFYPVRDGKPMAETALHREIMIYCICALEAHYADDPMIHIAGNNFLYYVQGNPKKAVSPDVYVVYGVRHSPRDTYKVWDENGITPGIVFEFTSKSTKDDDNNKKYPLYEQVLKVDEYFRYDPTGDYLNPRLQGFRLERGTYKPIPLENGDRIFSRNLGLYLVMIGENFRFFDPRLQEYLKTPQEGFDELKLTTQELNQTTQVLEQTSQILEQATQELNQTADELKQTVQELEAKSSALETVEEENARLRAELEQWKRSGT